MVIKKGYWRINNNSDIIVHCDNLEENCYGSEINNYCVQGHIGPLCESCDFYGKLWKNEHYAIKSKFICSNC